MNQGLGEVRSCWFTKEVRPLRHQESGRAKQQLIPTLFIFHQGKAYSGLERLVKGWPDSVLRSVIFRLNSFHQARANPRSFVYMQKLINSQLGGVESAHVNDLARLPYLGELEQIVLLWPDGNGMGWSNIERQVLNEKNDGTAVYVLNGRNRLFELQRPLWREYRLRRFLEKSFLVEMGVLGVFLVTAPVLALWDMVCDARKGHQ